MFSASELTTRQRAFAAGVIHRVWSWITDVGIVSPDDARGQRYRRLGVGSALGFPPGPIVGEGWISIGSGTLIGPFVSLAAGLPDEPLGPDDGPFVVIGDRCNIGRGSSINGRCSIVIEDDVTTGPNVYITDHNHQYADIDVPIGRQWVDEAPVRIGAGSWLGTGVVVLPGADIGRHVTVAAGSVVRGKVPDNSVIAGAPAKVVRQFVDGEGWVPDLTSPVRPPPAGWPAR
jgi:acetyltransferase-like isoleucine patch superfamily enzyme